MSGVSDLHELLSSMDPTLVAGEYVFISLPGVAYGGASHLAPIASFAEREGMTLIIPKERADAAAIDCDETFRMITLRVHSSLGAVGLTAAVSRQLARRGISANIVAAYYHDHIFVPSSRADEALLALQQIGTSR